MFGARKRGLIRQKIQIIRFFSLFYFYLDPNVSLNQQKKQNFSVHSRKFYFGRFANVSAPKVLKCLHYTIRFILLRRRSYAIRFLSAQSHSFPVGLSACNASFTKDFVTPPDEIRSTTFLYTLKLTWRKHLTP